MYKHCCRYIAENIHGELVCTYDNKGKKVSLKHPKCIHYKETHLPISLRKS